MAKALLVSPDSQSIESVEINNTADIVDLVGFDTLESDALGDGGDHLYFDESCFIRGTAGRFQIDALIPVAGRGVVVGVADGDKFTDVSLTIDQLRARTKFQ